MSDKKDKGEEVKALTTEELIKQLLDQNQQLIDQNTQLAGRVEALEGKAPATPVLKKKKPSQYKAPVSGEYRCVFKCFHNYIRYNPGDYEHFDEGDIVPVHFVPPGSKEEAAERDKKPPKLGTIVQKAGKGANTLKEIQERK